MNSSIRYQLTRLNPTQDGLFVTPISFESNQQNSVHCQRLRLLVTKCKFLLVNSLPVVMFLDSELVKNLCFCGRFQVVCVSSVMLQRYPPKKKALLLLGEMNESPADNNSL